jgi:hypothetical protein
MYGPPLTARETLSVATANKIAGLPGGIVDCETSPEVLVFGKLPSVREPATSNLPRTFSGQEVRRRVFRPYALPRVKDNKAIGVADEYAPEEHCGQQSIFLGR